MKAIVALNVLDQTSPVITKKIGKTIPMLFRDQSFHIIPTALCFQTIPLILLVATVPICASPKNNFDLAQCSLSRRLSYCVIDQSHP
jgi:hypothetical protein